MLQSDDSLEGARAFNEKKSSVWWGRSLGIERALGASVLASEMRSRGVEGAAGPWRGFEKVGPACKVRSILELDLEATRRDPQPSRVDRTEPIPRFYPPASE